MSVKAVWARFLQWPWNAILSWFGILSTTLVIAIPSVVFHKTLFGVPINPVSVRLVFPLAMMIVGSSHYVLSEEKYLGHRLGQLSVIAALTSAFLIGWLHLHDSVLGIDKSTVQVNILIVGNVFLFLIIPAALILILTDRIEDTLKNDPTQNISKISLVFIAEFSVLFLFCNILPILGTIYSIVI